MLKTEASHTWALLSRMNKTGSSTGKEATALEMGTNPPSFLDKLLYNKNKQFG